MKWLIRKFSHPLRGMWYALVHDKGFQFQIVVTGSGVIIFALLFSPFLAIEWIVLLFAYISVLVTEMQNSSSEEALNRLHPELHDSIKRSKDMAAASVLLSGFGLAVVMLGIVLL